MNQIALIIVLLCCNIIVESQFYLERGERGIVSCPAMTQNGYTLEETAGVRWSFCPKGSSDPPRKIITYYEGIVTTENSNDDRYDIKNVSLEITSVDHLSEGTYSYKYMPRQTLPILGSVEVREKVSCKAKRPRVDGCNREEASCEVPVSFDTVNFSLVCSVDHVKPVVDIRWFQWSAGVWEDMNATTKVDDVICDCFKFNNTYNITATVKATLQSCSTRFKCVTNSTGLENTTVTVTKSSVAHRGDNFVTEFTSQAMASAEPTAPVTCSECACFTFFVACPISFIIGIIVAVLTMYMRSRLLLRKRAKEKNKEAVQP